MHTCSDCGQPKPLSEYYLDNRTGRPRSRCKPCYSNFNRENRQKNKHRWKKYPSGWTPETRVKYQDDRKKLNSYLQRTYGITADDFDEMLESQGGVCAICLQEEQHLSRNGNKKRLAVDHCHETGKVRGLLCKQCNTGLGKFYDDKSRLRRAIDYLGE